MVRKLRTTFAQMRDTKRLSDPAVCIASLCVNGQGAALTPHGGRSGAQAEGRAPNGRVRGLPLTHASPIASPEGQTGKGEALAPAAPRALRPGGSAPFPGRGRAGGWGVPHSVALDGVGSRLCFGELRLTGDLFDEVGLPRYWETRLMFCRLYSWTRWRPHQGSCSGA